MKTFNDEEWKKYFLKHFPELAKKYSRNLPARRIFKKRGFKDKIKKVLEFLNFLNIKSSLCEKCRYNSHRYCVNPERPFALNCEDYQKKL